MWKVGKPVGTGGLSFPGWETGSPAGVWCGEEEEEGEEDKEDEEHCAAGMGSRVWAATAARSSPWEQFHWLPGDTVPKHGIWLQGTPCP